MTEIRRPEWVCTGRPWSWISCSDHTAIRVPSGGAKRGYQHVILLDWGEFDRNPECGKHDAEELAEFVVKALNSAEM